jgi:hypothetical protein
MTTNLRDSNRGECCLTCIHFQSYMQKYEDDLEPDDFGVCTNENIDNDVNFNFYTTVGILRICDLFERDED